MLWPVVFFRFCTLAYPIIRGDFSVAVGTQVTLDKRLKVVSGRNRPNAGESDAAQNNTVRGGRQQLWGWPHGRLGVLQADGMILLDLTTHAFKFLNKSSDFLEDSLLFFQVLRVQRTHLGEKSIELSAAVTGKLPF